LGSFHKRDEKPTSEQKREKRFAQWLDAKDVEFKSPSAKTANQERVTRFIKVFNLGKPDRGRIGACFELSIPFQIGLVGFW